MKPLSEEEFAILLATDKVSSTQIEPEEIIHPAIEHNKILENILLQLSNSIITQSNVQKDSLTELSSVLIQNREVQESLKGVIDLISSQNKAILEKKLEPPRTKTFEFTINRDAKGDMSSLTATVTSEVTT